MPKLETLKNILQLLVAGGSILYLFGFLTINAYLGRFGIASFDILNARYVIAGIFSMCSIAIGLVVSWIAFKALPFKDFFDLNHFRKRGLTLIYIISSIFGLSFAVTTFFNLGRYQAPISADHLYFKAVIPNYDFLGDFISSLNIVSGSVDYLIKNTIYIFSYIFLLYLCIIAVCIIYSWIPRKKDAVSPATTEQNTNTEEDVAPKPKKPTWMYLSLFLVDFIIISGYLAVAVYAYYKLRVNLFDFNSLSNTSLTSALVFSWLFGFVLTMYFFLNWTFPKAEVNLKLFDFTDVNSYEMIFRQGVVPILGSIILFGWVIFPRIPFAIGGGQPREIEWKLKTEIPLDANSRIYLLDESSQFIFVATVSGTTSQAMQVGKEQVEYIRTRKATSTPQL